VGEGEKSVKPESLRRSFYPWTLDSTDSEYREEDAERLKKTLRKRGS